MIISYCTHSGLRQIDKMKSQLTPTTLIISYCTHSGLRPRLLASACTAFCGLYLIARIADCDNVPVFFWGRLFLIISYCTHSGLRLRNHCCHDGNSGGIISYCTHSGLRLTSTLVSRPSSRRLYLIARIADCDVA